MKFLLKKDLPLAKAGIEVDVCRYGDTDEYSVAIYLESEFHTKHIADIGKKDIPEWLEEVKEPRTIYDLKEGIYFYLTEFGKIENRGICSGIWADNAHIRCFITEREAKRNKLLRELATREKFLPKHNELFCSFHNGEVVFYNWTGNSMNFVSYHLGFVFKDKKEYDKYINEEATDLLFNF